MEEIKLVEFLVILSSGLWVVTAIKFYRHLSALHVKIDVLNRRFSEVMGADEVEQEQDPGGDGI